MSTDLRPVAVRVRPDVEVTVYEGADAEALLRRATGRPGADPYSHVLWPAAIAAAEQLARVVQPGERVLELGAGTGLVAMTAARLGARATALDHDADALDAIGAAAAAQSLEIELIEFDMTSDAPLPDADLLVCADVLYEAALARAAGARVVEAVRRGMRALVADPGREGRIQFDDVVESAGLEVRFASISVLHPRESERTPIDVGWFGTELSRERA